MAEEAMPHPAKTRELRNHHFDSTIWNEFAFRDDDIVIATYAKSGTTWVQQIVAQLVFGGRADVAVAEISPWLDLRIPPKEQKLAMVEAQTHRRFLKTHLPVDALVFSPRAKYLYVGRDGRDVVWSLHNHHARANQLWYELLNNTPGRVGPPIGPPPASVVAYFDDWLARDGHPFWPFWENVRGWWALRRMPNVMLLHYDRLRADLAGEIRRIAAFLGIGVDAAAWPAILEHCSFEHMRANAEAAVPLGGAVWEGGARTFLHKGTSGRWRGALDDDRVAAYEARAEAELGPACARWLATGEGS